MKSFNKTFLPNQKYKNYNWYIINCKNQSLGRLSTYIVNLLSGKGKSYYYPSINTGDYIILTNIQSIIMDQKKIIFSVYNPGYPGRALKAKKVYQCSPKLIVERSIKQMLSKTKVKDLLNKLRFYNDNLHTHQAQNPININIKDLYFFNLK
uniref:50S ribosomal protein L13 n=1 Tax=Nitzschia alba TaxID=2858 RepID=A0A5C0F2M0_NITAL|nr:50S ribosomal protein L13 [Nitzschia alba]QEI59604.1 50S ribosomal protein L13 [Nitzschia alba]